MHWPSLALSDYLAIIGLIGGALTFIFKMIQKMRTNDLAHLDQKIDLHHRTVMQTVSRIEGKLDEHVRDHAAGMFDP
jgi:hypothetical protein